MKKLSLLFLAVMLIANLPLLGQKEKKSKKNAPPVTVVEPLATFTDTISYLLGYSVYNDLKNNNIEINSQSFIKGFNEAQSNAEPLLSEDKMEMVMMKFQQMMQDKVMAEKEEKLKGARKEAADFLEANKAKEGVFTTPSGLQYQIINEGSGDSPSSTDRVTAHYEGSLIDGTVFDSSYERGEPVSFPLNQVITGWTEGLQLMKPGAVYVFYIPSDLGYGDSEVGPIPAGSVLIFKVELIAFEKNTEEDYF